LAQDLAQDRLVVIKADPIRAAAVLAAATPMIHGERSRRIIIATRSDSLDSNRAAVDASASTLNYFYASSTRTRIALRATLGWGIKAQQIFIAEIRVGMRALHIIPSPRG